MCLSPLRYGHGCLKIRKPTRQLITEVQAYLRYHTSSSGGVSHVPPGQAEEQAALDSSWNFSSSNGRVEYPCTYPVNPLF